MVNPTPLRPRRPPPPPPTPPPGGWPSWHSRLERDKGRIVADLANVLIALRGEDQLVDAIAYDEMAKHSIVTAIWPTGPEAKPVKPPPHETDDDDIARLTEWLQAMGIRRIGREIVGIAVEMVAREHSFHPVKDYLNGCVGNGATLIDRWMFTYLGAEAADDDEAEYVVAIGKMFLIAMVARIFEPGCQCDYMPVLEGDQGVLKSSACRVLAGQWFSDSLPENITSKDARQHLRGKWLVEVSELAAYSRAENEAIKAFISRREERYRPPFGRHDVMEPRQNVFAGTTNKTVYLKDETGGRRFWPVACAAIDVEGLAQARDQLFAEAVALYRAGEKHWPDADFERKFFKPQQDKRQEEDPWHTTVAEALEATSATKFTVSWIARTCLGFDGDSRIGKAEQNRITIILNDLGCTPLKRTGKGRYWQRPSLVSE
jgi:predicted P-loop ATPase